MGFLFALKSFRFSISILSFSHVPLSFDFNSLLLSPPFFSFNFNSLSLPRLASLALLAHVLF